MGRSGISLPGMFLLFRRSELVWPSVEPVARCIAVASAIACISVVLYGGKTEAYRIACRCFLVASISSGFSVVALQKRRIIVLKALFGAGLYGASLALSFMGVLMLLIDYDLKSARILLVGPIVLFVTYAIVAGTENRINRRSREPKGE